MRKGMRMGQDTAEQVRQLPEQGRGLVKEVEQRVDPGDWDLAEKALLALKALAEMPGGPDLMQACHHHHESMRPFNTWPSNLVEPSRMRVHERGCNWLAVCTSGI